MGKLKLSALLLGAALFLSLGTTSLLAESCDNDCKKECCSVKKVCDKDCKKSCCDDNKSSKSCDKDDKKSTKCGGEAKSASTMKCGAGKCGSK